MEPIDYREMKPGEEPAACELVVSVFDELVAPDYERDGIEEFHRFADPAAMAKRVRSGGFVLMARQSGSLVGVIEFTLPDHIRLLFVALRRQGIAGELVARAVEKARSESPALTKITVNSSPYAEAVYRRLRFRRTGSATTENGIRFIPMELSLE
jgi:RimJ/RimL family protein N-acetyltransferase